MSCFSKWITATDGVENVSKIARNCLEVHFHLMRKTPGTAKYYNRIGKLMSDSNLFLLRTMKNLAILFETGLYRENNDLLIAYRNIIKNNHEYFKLCIDNTVKEFLQVVSPVNNTLAN